jgi:hypothetical protein
LKTRILLAGLAVVAAMAFSASSALAVTASPVGQFAATSGAVNFKVDNLGFTCNSSKLGGVVGTNGAIHGLNDQFSTCQSGLGPTTVTANQLIQFEMAFDSNGLGTTLGNINLSFNAANSGCRFNVTGTESTENLGFSPLTLSELVFPTSSPPPPATLKLTSFPTGETSHCFGLLTLNSPVTFQATYKLSPSLTITK